MEILWETGKVGRKQNSGDTWFSLFSSEFLHSLHQYILVYYLCIVFDFLGKEIEGKKGKLEMVFKINMHENIKII